MYGDGAPHAMMCTEIVQGGGGGGDELVEYVGYPAQPIGHVLEGIGGVDAAVPVLQEEAGRGYPEKFDIWHWQRQ